MPPDFLELDEVLYIHADQIERYGGDAAIRDVALLDSALAMPRATFDGAFVHRDLYEMGAAYLYHVIQNHPFVDGNKRTGTAAALVFLALNGVTIVADEDVLVALVLDVAQGRADKPRVAEFFRTNSG